MPAALQSPTALFHSHGCEYQDFQASLFCPPRARQTPYKRHWRSRLLSPGTVGNSPFDGLRPDMPQYWQTSRPQSTNTLIKTYIYICMFIYLSFRLLTQRHTHIYMRVCMYTVVDVFKYIYLYHLTMYYVPNKKGNQSFIHRKPSLNNKTEILSNGATG